MLPPAACPATAMARRTADRLEEVDRRRHPHAAGDGVWRQPLGDRRGDRRRILGRAAALARTMPHARPECAARAPRPPPALARLPQLDRLGRCPRLRRDPAARQDARAPSRPVGEPERPGRARRRPAARRRAAPRRPRAGCGTRDWRRAPPRWRSTARPPGRSACARLRNAATGSAKNITPNRDTTRSKPPARRSAAVCASPSRKLDPPASSGVTRCRARATSRRSEMSTPTARPPRTHRLRQRQRRRPVPQPTSSTASPGRGAASRISRSATGRIAASSRACSSTQVCRRCRSSRTPPGRRSAARPHRRSPSRPSCCRLILAPAASRGARRRDAVRDARARGQRRGPGANTLGPNGRRRARGPCARAARPGRRVPCRA